MGIHKLMSLLNEKAPGSIRKVDISAYSGRTVACDATMAMYQFLISTQGYVQSNFSLSELTDKDGNKTGHLVGLFNRTIQFLENGIKPVWCFDGKPPSFKSGELAKRKKAKQEATEKMEDAKEEGDMEEALKQKLRTTYITQTMKEDAIKMLELMGVPVIKSPSEAEAQCAVLCKTGKVFASATEDMDSLTFGTKILLRNFNSKKEPIHEINFDQMLKELEMSYEEFIDLCILCGCDYTEWIEGVGPVTAFKLMKQHGSIEKVLEWMEKENESSSKKRKYGIPNQENFNYKEARLLFSNPEVDDPEKLNLKWTKPNEEGLKQFLIEEKSFAESRVMNGLKKIKSNISSGVQTSLESFFGKPSIQKVKSTSQSAQSKKNTKTTVTKGRSKK